MEAEKLEISCIPISGMKCDRCRRTRWTIFQRWANYKVMDVPSDELWRGDWFLCERHTRHAMNGKAGGWL